MLTALAKRAATLTSLKVSSHEWVFRPIIVGLDLCMFTNLRKLSFDVGGSYVLEHLCNALETMPALTKLHLCFEYISFECSSRTHDLVELLFKPPRRVQPIHGTDKPTRLQALSSFTVENYFFDKWNLGATLQTRSMESWPPSLTSLTVCGCSDDGLKVLAHACAGILRLTELRVQCESWTPIVPLIKSSRLRALHIELNDNGFDPNGFDYRRLIPVVASNGLELRDLRLESSISVIQPLHVGLLHTLGKGCPRLQSLVLRADFGDQLVRMLVIS